MHSSPSTTPPSQASIMEELLAQADWIRELAAQLIHDPGTAEDLAQDTLVAAVESPPSSLQNPRAWLATVLRNRMRSRFQRESQRRQRESDSVHSDVAVSTDELFARADLQHELAAHVLELDEIYKEVLLLRYFEGLDPQQAARRLGIKATTVRTRTRRALEHMRLRLDRDYGDRSTWSLALLPLVRMPKATTASATSKLLHSKWLVGITLATLAVALTWQHWAPTPAIANPPITTARVAPAAASKVPASTPRTAQAKTSTRQPQLTPSAAPPLHLTGRIVDEEGRPAPGMRVRWNQNTFRNTHDGLVNFDANQGRPGSINARDRARLEAAGGDLLVALRNIGADEGTLWWTQYFMEHDGIEPFGASDSSGSWDIELPGGFPGSEAPLAQAFCLGDASSTLIAWGLEEPPGENTRTVLVAAPAVSISGWVQDTEGNPVAGAGFTVSAGLAGLRNFPLELEETRYPMRQHPRSAADGSFRLTDLPAFEGNKVVVTSEGFESSLVLVPSSDLDGLVVRLSPNARQTESKVTGVVLDSSGAPVPDATVWLGTKYEQTDHSGHFALDPPSRDSSTSSHILATKLGYQLARQPWSRAAHASGDELRLQLGPPPLSITGRIVSEHGPTDGWRAVLLDGTQLGASPDPAESEAANASNYAMNRTVIRVDDDGSFAFHGLSNRDYTLRFWNMIDADTFDLGPLPAGSRDVLARPNATPPIPRVSGVVTDSLGTPLSDVTVDLTLSLTSGPIRSSQPMQRTVTGVDGSFHFEQVPSARYGIQIHGDGIARESWPERSPEALTAPLDLVADTTYRFQLMLAANDPADRFEVFAGGHYPISIQVHQPWLTLHSPDAKRDESGFPITEVSCRAQELALYRGDTELRRIPLAPRRGEVEKLFVGLD